MMGLYIPKQPPVEIAVSGSSFVKVTSCIKCNNYRKDTDVVLRRLLANLTCFHNTIYLVTGATCALTRHIGAKVYGASLSKPTRGSGSQCASGENYSGRHLLIRDRGETWKQLPGEKAFCVWIWLQCGCLCQQLNSRESPCWLGERPASAQGMWHLSPQQTQALNKRQWNRSSDTFSLRLTDQ